MPEIITAGTDPVGKSMAIEEKTIEINGEKIAYLERSGIEPAVFLHGNSGNRFSWEKTISLLPEKYHAFSIDLPLDGEKKSFSGLSAFVNDFFEANNISQASLVGHSLGGLVALKIAFSFPEKVKKMVVVSSPLTDLRKRFLTKKLTEKVNGSEDKIKLLEYYEKHKDFWDRILVRLLASEDNNQERRKKQPSRLAPFVKDFILSDWEKELSSLKQPVLFIYGKKDFFLKFLNGCDGYQWTNNRQVAVIKDGSHILLREKPDELARIIDRFLSEEEGFSFAGFFKRLFLGK